MRLLIRWPTGLRLAGLSAAVAAVHLLLVLWWADAAMVGWGAGHTPPLARLDAAFVRTLAPAAPPPPPVAAPAPPARPSAARPIPDPPEPAASAASAATGPPAVLDSPAAPVPDAPRADTAVHRPADAASAPGAAVDTVVAMPSLPASSADVSAPVDAASMPAPALAPAAVAAAASAGDAVPAVAFEWPPSTRLRYRLTGHYRGEVHGNAQVQWVRQGDRYQVHLDVSVGPSFAPFMSRRMTSDGVIGPDGLRPLRYDEETSVAFRPSRRVAMRFGPQAVVLGTGREVAPLPGVQDTASQFVQMTWWFNMDPSRLQPGQVVQMPLALPRRQEMWLYDVIGPERLDTPIGTVDAVHVRPRRAAVRGGDLVAEIWFAPTLQYLPVRIRIRQDDETWVDLVVATAPLQAER